MRERSDIDNKEKQEDKHNFAKIEEIQRPVKGFTLLPSLVEEAKEWEGCVQETMSHSKFAASFRFKPDRDWVKPRKHGSWCSELPHGK